MPYPRWTKVERREVWEEWDGICMYCDRPVSFNSGWHMAHVGAHAKGGSDDISNMRPAHARCNRSASDRGSWMGDYESNAYRKPFWQLW